MTIITRFWLLSFVDDLKLAMTYNDPEKSFRDIWLIFQSAQYLE